jgi:response regulator RpfG family c-di-GMP phosphodiesterase
MIQRILFVDDEPRVLNGLRRLLSDRPKHWEICFAGSADEALELLHSESIDTVVSDINMPGKDGFELLKTIRETEAFSDVPVVILTGNAETDLKRQALNLGATDLLTKPVDAGDLVARLRNTLQLKAYQDELRGVNRILELRVKERTRQLESSRLNIVWRLAKVAELHDHDTGEHIARVGCYCRAIAEAMDLGSEFAELMYVASPLHDIGKVGIPDRILKKPGPLTPDERAIMNTHCEIGYRILRDETRNELDMVLPHAGLRGMEEVHGNRLTELGATIALSHHEKWDGSGYPRGLSSQDIPLAGRIVAVADVFDALCSNRVYRSGFAPAEAHKMMQEGVGSHFDPEVYASFLRAIESLPEFSLWYRTGEAPGILRAA